MSTQLKLAAPVLIFGCLIGSLPAAGGVVAVSRQTTIHASIVNPPVNVEQSKTLSTFADFVDSVSVSDDQTGGMAQADQTSSLTIIGGQLTKFDVNGNSLAGDEGEAEGDGNFHLVFDVTSPSVQLLTSGVVEGGGQSGGAGHATLTDLTSSATVFDLQNFEFPTSLDGSFNLKAGRYDLVVTYNGGSFGAGDATLNARFAAAAPLPPAVWGGAALLIVCAAGIASHRRPHAAHR